MADPSSSLRHGLLAAVAVTVLFASMEATAKLLSERYDPFFVVWVRYVGQALGTLILFAPVLPRIVRTGRLGLQVLRSALLFGATVFFFWGYAMLPLAEATAIGQVTPIMIMALAALVLGERVSALRWGAALVGLAGALVIVQPGGAAFAWAALLPIGGALTFAGFSIATRALGASESAWTTFFYTGMVGAVAASVAVPFVWETPDWSDAPLLLAVGAFGAAGQAVLIFAMRWAEASAVAPVFYVQLIWATMLGYLIWGDVPAAATLVGAAMIIGAGLFVQRREARAARRLARPCT